ncbi:unnamed protein product [Fusarium graminearum]|nr:hypothetical protein HG531_006732 [Fusarium graminearum]CAF3460941.1 unnamed protein product [Fusarium graminearum]
MRVSSKLANVLREHLQPFTKDGPCFSMDTMRVADSVYIWSSLMNRRMNQKPSTVGWSCTVAANDLAVEIDENHVTDFQQAKVSSQGVCPESIGELGVANGNVTAHTLNVAFAVPVAKGSSKML